jgi:hypothetical protein
LLIVLSPAKRLDFTEADPACPPVSGASLRIRPAGLTARGRTVAELRRLMSSDDPPG